MKPILKVLHLASFTGNIGDNANHLGARAQFAENLSFSFDYTELEMREFFWGQRQWDSVFVSYANQFDLLLIGGGNYFELWVEKSRTGCSIDLPNELLATLCCPVLFYGLGVDAGQGVSDACRSKFANFLGAVLANDRMKVAVRNDGAMATLAKYFSALPLERVLHLPDGGFFFHPRSLQHPELEGGSSHIAINLAGDMLETRFPGGAWKVSKEEFLQQFCAVMTDYLRSRSGSRVVFIPHIYKDLSIIHEALNYFPDEYRRGRIAVAPYFSGSAAAHKLFDLYRQCDLSLAMRFHANVCSLANGVPTLGLVCYPQIEFLYDELQLQSQAVQVSRQGFAPLLATFLQNPPSAMPTSLYNAQLFSIKQAHAEIDRWLLACHTSIPHRVAQQPVAGRIAPPQVR